MASALGKQAGRVATAGATAPPAGTQPASVPNGRGYISAPGARGSDNLGRGVYDPNTSQGKAPTEVTRVAPGSAGSTRTTSTNGRTNAQSEARPIVTTGSSAVTGNLGGGAPATPRAYSPYYQVTPGYDMSIPGASEYAVGIYGNQTLAPGYAEQYASQPGMYETARASTSTNRLLDAYAGSVAQPTAFENYAYSTPAPTGQAYGTIAANQSQVSGTSDLMNYARSAAPQTGAIQQTMTNQAGLVSGPSQLTGFAQNGPSAQAGAGTYYATQGQVTGPNRAQYHAEGAPDTTQGLNAYANSLNQVQGTNDVLGHGQRDQTDQDRGYYALAESKPAVTGPTRINDYMANGSGYNTSVEEGVGWGTANTTRPMVTGNTLGQYASDPNAQYLAAGNSTASQREMIAAGNDMASGVDSTTAAGRYWEQLQQDPTKLPDANLDAYYERQRTKAQQGIDKAMAARGLFGSSASVDATREMMLDLSAQQVKDESDYSLASALARNDIQGGAARDADTSGLARYTARNGVAQGVDQAALGLGRLGLDARTANDSNTLARYTAQNDVAGNLDQRGLDLYLGRGDLTNRADLTDATRFSAYNQAANAVDQTDIDAYNARTSALDAGGRLDVSRFAASNDAAQGIDRNSIAAYGEQADALLGAGQLDVNRFAANNDAAQGLDRNSIAGYSAQAGAMSDAGQLDIGRYNASIGAANMADRVGIDSYTAQGNVLRDAGQLDVNRFSANTGATNDADRTALDRYATQSDVLNNASSLGLDRYRALTEGATAADAAARNLYQTGSDVSRTADQSFNDRIGTLIQGAGAADLSRTGRTQVAQGAAQNNQAMLDSILSSGYGDLIQSDEDLMQLIASLGLGAGAQNLQGAIGNQGAVAGNGAVGVGIGAANDATVRNIALGR